MWAQAKPQLPAWVRAEDGLFGMNECPRGCPQIECIPCSFYGNQPLVYFFPQLALSTLRGYKGYQYSDGAAVWVFGGCTGQTPPIDFANPTRGYQFATNGISLAAMVDRYWLCHGEREPEFAREFLPIVKQNMTYTVNLRPAYPLGNFNTSGATSLPPDAGGLDPERCVDLTYFVDERGFSRGMAPMPGPGPTWIGGLAVLRDEHGPR